MPYRQLRIASLRESLVNLQFPYDNGHRPTWVSVKGKGEIVMRYLPDGEENTSETSAIRCLPCISPCRWSACAV